jgi:tRNA pseudouridine38-40 synthase
MFKYRLDISYDGKEFSGSQIQPHRRTVEGELITHLSKLCTFADLTFSGRTDAGVHARQQVVSFESTIDNEDKIRKSLSRMLPRDIRVKNIKKVYEGFDARYSAKSRTYVYFIKNIAKSIPTDRHTTLFIEDTLDLTKLNRASQLFVGKNDYKNFSKEGSQRNTVKMITQANWKELKGLYRFTISGDSFLWQMVRSIVGSLLALNDNKLKEIDIMDYLNSKELRRIPYISAPDGLFLWKVKY